MRYVVTGATGFVGGCVVRQLKADAHEVLAVVRDPGRASSALADVTLVAGDVAVDADRATLVDALVGADGLFHIAGWYKIGTRDRAEGKRVNVDGTRNVLTAAREAGVPKVVYTSTLAVNSDTGGRVVDESYHYIGRHLSVYDDTKAQAHHIAQQFASAGLPLVIVMPGLVYGPGDTSQTGAMIRDVVKGRRVVVPRGARLCWGYIDDIAHGHILSMERGRAGDSYMLAGPPHTLDEALTTVARIARTHAPAAVPAPLVRGTAAVTGLVERFVSLPPLLSSEAMRAGAASYLGSPAKAVRELGWQARPLQVGLEETVEAELGRRTSDPP